MKSKLEILKNRLEKVEKQLEKVRGCSPLTHGWQTQKYAKASRKWDILAQEKMKLIQLIEEHEKDKVVRICYDHLDKFTDIYPKDDAPKGMRWENKMPENVKLTVYCKGTNEEGFLINITSEELGLEALIAQKWIIHSELEKLAGHTLA